MVKIRTHRKNFKSIKQLAEAANVSYMTMYMRLRMGQKPTAAMKKPVRAYRKAA